MCAYHEVWSLSHPGELMHSHPGHECWEKMSEQLLNWDSRVAAACCYSSGASRLEPSNIDLKKLAGVLETLHRTELR